jgi:glycosyltransferase involved in cell wall biosynthesis
MNAASRINAASSMNAASRIRVVLSTPGKFHTFDLARELRSQGALEAVFTGYPRFKLRGEELPAELIHTFPWLHAVYMGFDFRRRFGERATRLLEYLDKVSLDRFVSRRMPSCDVFVGLSGSGLRSGRAARARGAKVVCDRGSTHIRVQDALMREEYALWGWRYSGIDPRVIELEESEYSEADCITVPSAFNVKSFLARGVHAIKLKRIPYGVNLERFHPVGEPAPGLFDVLFVGAMSLRKGVPYLLQAYRRLEHPRKSLTFAGSIAPDFIVSMKKRSLWADDIRVLGHVPQPELKAVMSRSHVLVLPSIEEGLAMVQAQALACGCPVIGTEHSGAEDLFEDGRQGFIVPIRRPDRITECLQTLADDSGLRAAFGAAALERVRGIGGWRDYGLEALSAYRALVA